MPPTGSSGGRERRHRIKLDNRLPRVFSISLLLAVCAAANAQTDSIAASYDIEEVEVGARYGREDAAARYGVKSGDFARLNVSDITSALRRLPGVTLRDYGGAGGMKTVSIRGTGTLHTGIALDGLVLPDGPGGGIDLQQFQLSGISSITLSATGETGIFLPARELSKASVLSIETRREEGLRAGFSAGSWGLWSPTLSFSREIKRVSVSLDGGYSQAANNYGFLIENGADTHREHRKNSGTRQGWLDGGVLWWLTDNSSLGATFRAGDNRRELPGAVHLYSNDNDERLRDKTLLLQSLYRLDISDKWRVKAALRWNTSGQAYRNGQPSGGVKSEDYLSREYYATASVLFTPLRGLSLGYSADFWHERMHTTITGRERVHRNSVLQALSAGWNVRGFFLLGQVLRSDIGKEHRLSPAIAASYRILRGRELYVRISFKDIFRMPTMNELYYYHLGTPDLRPEKTRQANLGASFRHVPGRCHGFGIETSLNAYLNSVTDKIVAIPFNMFVYRYLNVEKTAGRGFDWMIDAYYVFPGKQTLSLTVNYSLQDIETRPSDRNFPPRQIAYTPLSSGSGTLCWQNPWVNVSATFTAVSKTWTTNEHDAGTKIAGYAEWGASLWRSVRIRDGGLDVRCTVQNLLDRNYCIVARYPMPGRNFNISVTYNFL